MRGLRVALQFLTRVPLPGPAPTPRELGRSAVYFPVAGLLLGAASLGVYWGAGFLVPRTLARVLALVSQVLLSGALHLDGLADTVDGLAGGTDREEVLRIMRDPHVGALGVVAIVVVLLLKAAAVVLLPEARVARALLVAPAVGRGAMVVALRLPYAREAGVGRAFADSRLATDAIVALLLVLGLCLLSFRLLGVAALLAALGCGGGLLAIAWRKVGGVTGDVCGAVGELAETGFLVAVLGEGAR
jgi:adenosylcobinamide-GDP ribazoletransferase